MASSISVDTLTTKTNPQKTIFSVDPSTNDVTLANVTAGNICKAWVRFDGTTNTGGLCTIQDSFNVSSVTDNANGNYTVTFDTEMANTNYSFTATASNNAVNDSTNYVVGGYHTFATDALTFKVGYASNTSSGFTLSDALQISAHIFGD
tara:strand:- start:2031 stop:2477 length:447 start_codon:yes stop_codon:yes gene_type:complete